MSSDESEVEEDGTECIITHRLPWLSDVVENFKRLLDEESVRMKSPQAIRQTKVRNTGNESSRQQPTNKDEYPSWIFSYS